MTAQVAGMAAVSSASAAPTPTQQSTLPFQGLNQPNDVVVQCGGGNGPDCSSSGVNGESVTSNQIDTSDFGILYVADTNNNRVVELLDGHQSTLPFQGLNQPRGLALLFNNGDEFSGVVVADTGHNRIIVLPWDGTWMKQVILPFNGLIYPSSVAEYTYEDNTVAYFVADTGNNRVVELCTYRTVPGTGDCDAEYGSAQVKLPFSGLNQPRGVSIYNEVVGQGGNFPEVFVSDTNDNRVLYLVDNFYVYNINGLGLSQPSGLSNVDDCDHLYVADTNNNRIVGGAGGGFQFTEPFIGLNRPRGVASSGRDGFVFAADTGNNRIVAVSANSSNCDGG